MKFYELAWSFCRKKLQMCRNFATTRIMRDTKGEKSPVNATFSGRSMVEMLGVLAIIGVLSVGAIGGYSKAMMKYKLNKQAEQYNYLFAAILQYKDILIKEKPNVLLFLDNIRALPITFKGITTSYASDILGQKVRCNIHLNTNISCQFFFEAPLNTESCNNISQIAKTWSPDIVSHTWNAYSADGTFNGEYGVLYGDKYCNGTNKSCLRNATLADFDNYCKFCAVSNRCYLYITL